MTNKMKVLLVVCATIVALAGIGGWVYLRDRELRQQKELVEYVEQQKKQRAEYEQSQISDRESNRQQCEAAKSQNLDPTVTSFICNQ